MLRATNDGVTALIEHDGSVIASAAAVPARRAHGRGAAAHGSHAVRALRQLARPRRAAGSASLSSRSSSPPEAADDERTSRRIHRRRRAATRRRAAALDYLEVDPPEPGPRRRDRRAAAVGAHSAADGTEPHQRLAAATTSDGWMLVDTGLADDVCREAWHSLEAHDLGGPRAAPHLHHARPSGPHGALALAARAPRRAGVDVRDRRTVRRGDYLAHVDRTPCASSSTRSCTAHGMEIELEALRKAVGQGTRRLVRRPAAARARAAGRRGASQAAVATGTSSRPAAIAAGTCACTTRASEVLISGDQVLPTISPNVSVLPSRPEANPLREFLDSLARLEQCAPRHAGAAVARPAVPRPAPPHRTCCGRTISSSWRALREACREPQAALRPAAGHVRAPAARLSPLPGAGRDASRT